MNIAVRLGIVSLLAGMSFTAEPSPARAQQIDLCGSTDFAPDTGGSWLALCSAPNDEGLPPFISVAEVEYGPDGQTFITWHLTNHGHCAAAGDGPFKCQIRTEWGDEFTEGEGNYSYLLDHPVSRITTICSCFRF